MTSYTFLPQKLFQNLLKVFLIGTAQNPKKVNISLNVDFLTFLYTLHTYLLFALFSIFSLLCNF